MGATASDGPSAAPSAFARFPFALPLALDFRALGGAASTATFVFATVASNTSISSLSAPQDGHWMDA